MANRADLAPHRHIADPVHGRIELTKLETAKDRGCDQSDALVAVYLEVWAGERLINQDTIEA